ncbi:MAG: flavodoxin [Acetatifactor muris]|nr:flavodoxin [Acetatifactor muris]
MKKTFVTLSCFLLLLTVAACGSSNGNAGNNQTADSQMGTGSDEAGASAVGSEEETVDAKTDEAEASALADSNNGTEPGGSNILVAYFSRAGNMEFEEGVDAVTSASVNQGGDDISGNAQLLAQMAQEVTGGDLFFIETVEKYPAAYRDTTDQAKEEQDHDARPKLASHVEDMDDYDTIILIYPNWWGTLPQPVFTFLEEYDFSGKTIWPLCSHEGSGLGRSEGDIAELAPDAELAEGLAVRGSSAASSQADVEAWLSDLKVSE